MEAKCRGSKVWSNSWEQRGEGNRLEESCMLTLLSCMLTLLSRSSQGEYSMLSITGKCKGYAAGWLAVRGSKSV